ncbi:NADH dehydrogenase I, L subunit [Syntrophotalea carbinolica DSM 2380]|uniref:NADH dehydrogenase I, L subunit n=1 Tax=Syntrophotalea carbinolica (strain DSM 2380 / NBRC 103641 / GraBd1) TaxID=338963 RepID=Q3A817_SYNC1|nr:NADH-quinone oxidoreductase subunit L [Syntrophotalea carbinolica]ABA87475.1 NADH dehydrogenase I, L subunit [Syntrophotalea carbinolica DSM 2380]
MMGELLFLIPLLPLCGALIVMFAGGLLSRRVLAGVAITSVAASAAVTLWLWPLAVNSTRVSLFTWLEAGALRVPVEILFSPLSAAMALMVTSVSALIHLYAACYLHHEPDTRRFFALFNLFVFAMLVIVLADNLLLLFLGWEGVGFCSYALIGFWYRNPEFAAAGRKAFLVTRAADVLFGIALLWLFRLTGTLSMEAINSQAASMSPNTVTLIALLLLAGACGKSAQLPFSSWLPDAMAGPTPVSALIHAATMVTAGVYLLCRLFPLIALSPTALAVIGLVGTASAFYGAICALVQRDIKRVLAYSTISQVGYMFVAVGAGTVTGAMFHLLTHAFFKALLFMVAGVVIHLAAGEQDLFRLGQLSRRAPLLFWLLLAGALALAGVPLTSGFFSKDTILAACFARHTPWWTLLGVVGLITALLTAMYALRLVYLLAADRAAAAGRGPTPRSMAWPMLPLAVMALVGGQLNLPELWKGRTILQGWLQTASGMPVSHGLEWSLAAVTLLLVVAAWLGVRRHYRLAPAPSDRAGVRFLAAGWQLDAVIRRGLTAPFEKTGYLLQRTVERLLTTVLPAGLGRLCQATGQYLRSITSGYVSHYLAAMAWGTVLLLAMLLLVLW